MAVRQTDRSQTATALQLQLAVTAQSNWQELTVTGRLGLWVEETIDRAGGVGGRAWLLRFVLVDTPARTFLLKGILSLRYNCLRLYVHSIQ